MMHPVKIVISTKIILIHVELILKYSAIPAHTPLMLTSFDDFANFFIFFLWLDFWVCENIELQVGRVIICRFEFRK